MRKRRGNKQKKIIITSMVSVVFLFSVGYAAFSSEFLISGKGTIIEREILASEFLKSKTVTSGDGLYKDPIENDRYVYKGANPDNYIWLDLNNDTSKTDNEIYRIVSIELDNTIKVVSQNSIGNIVFDPGYETIISGITSASSVEGTRYSSISTDYCYQNSGTEINYYGCNMWGSKTTVLDSSGINVSAIPRDLNDVAYTLPNNEAHVNTYLNTVFLNSIDVEIQNKITTHLFNIGILHYSSEQSLATDVVQESAYKWRGKIALINATDYVKASTNGSCTSAYEYNHTPACYNNSVNHNYLFRSKFEWSLTPSSYSSPISLWDIYTENWLGANTYAHSNNLETRPSFYLSSDIILSGEGTFSVPYEIIS